MLRLLGWIASARDQQAAGEVQQSEGASGSGVTAVRRTPKLFPRAAQPDIVRAAQKDELYLQHLADACQDAVRRFLGPRRALQHARETQLVAELLYYGLTTGAGVQTLGEEYCDILQVTGPVGVAPAATRRTLLVLLQTLVPYLAQRVAASASLAAAEHGEPAPSAGAGGIFAWAAAADPSPALAVAAAQRRLEARLAEGSQHAALGAGGDGGAAADTEGPASSARAAAAAVGFRVYAAASRVCAAAGGSGRTAWAAAAAHAPEVVRLHLALFYFFGVYYHWAKRVTGTRYIFTGKLFERRPSYHLLGALLFLQLGISAAGWGLARLQASVGAGAAPAAGGTGAGAGERDRKFGPAVLLQEDGAEAAAGSAHAAPAAAAGEWVEVPQRRRCALCLGARDAPTATPCGHVFCWACISAWHNQKPECPLCRAPFGTAGLVCVYNGDF